MYIAQRNPTVKDKQQSRAFGVLDRWVSLCCLVNKRQQAASCNHIAFFHLSEYRTTQLSDPALQHGQMAGVIQKVYGLSRQQI